MYSCFHLNDRILGLASPQLPLGLQVNIWNKMPQPFFSRYNLFSFEVLLSKQCFRIPCIYVFPFNKYLLVGVISVSYYTSISCQDNTHFVFLNVRVVVKKLIFYGQADCKGWPPSVLFCGPKTVTFTKSAHLWDHKMDLQLANSKFYGHFYSSNIPKVWGLGFFFMNLLFLGPIWPNFYIIEYRAYFGHFSLVKSVKNIIVFLQRMECSNKKMKEKKSGLEFNFPLKSECGSLIFFVDFSPSPNNHLRWSYFDCG